ncbi:MAG: esterase [Anaerolineae bacterium]
MSDQVIQTVKGAVPVDSLGLFLPHEHLFTDLRGPLTIGYGKGNPDQVVEVMRPYLEAAQARGVTALAECTGLGVGRNVAVLRRLADITPIHIIAPTGVYKQGFIPPDLLNMSAEALADLFVRDLLEGMDGTDSRAGSSRSRSATTDRAAKPAICARRRSPADGRARWSPSHTIGGAAALREFAILEDAGHDLSRFIWVHAHTEPDTAQHVEAARRGVWLEFDAVGAESWHPQAALLRSVLALIEAGYVDNLLLSHDAGWYDPGQVDGQPQPNGIRGYTALVDDFIPALRSRGVDDATIHRITVINPARAFAWGSPT